MITLHNVSKRFGTFQAITSATLHINSGEVHGIIGASGAGKSTLLRLMNLIEHPDEGEVIVDGQTLNHLQGKRLRHMRQTLAMIFQGYHLVGNKTVFDNVVVALELAKDPKKGQTAKVMESLEFVGLDSLKDQYPAQLSGGQKQRVAIARAIVNQPRVLLCDEPTSSLDPNTTAEVLEVLRRINQEFGVTIVLVSHDMEVIKSVCERVTVMDHGQVYETVKIEPTGIQKLENSAEEFVKWLRTGGDEGLV